MPIKPFVYDPPLDALQIIYQDDDFVVIDKPAGLLSVMGRKAEHQDSAYLRILQLFPSAKVIHRLDMATSGILVFAKNRHAEVAMSKLFQARAVEKNYTALVQGKLEAKGCIDLPLITDWPNRPKQKVDFEIGKPAQTLFETIAYHPDQDISRVLLTPLTGRSHQLRLHLAHIGNAIIGDQLYHPQPNIPLGRLALHADMLRFTHPIQQTPLLLTSEVPF